jgi:hypothetical protein
MVTTKLIGRENLTTNACWLVLADLLTRKIKLACIKSAILGLGTFSVVDPDPFDTDRDADPAF